MTLLGGGVKFTEFSIALSYHEIEEKSEERNMCTPDSYTETPIRFLVETKLFRNAQNKRSCFVMICDTR